MTTDNSYPLTVESFCFQLMWDRCFQECFRETEYMAQLAGISFGTMNTPDHLSFSFLGYNDGMMNFVNAFFKQLKHAEVTEAFFKDTQDRLVRAY